MEQKEKTNIIIEQNITNTLEVNYMPYAMSVIISRAIPQIDGFKPAHRKLLYTMYKMGLLGSDRTKSTNVVGQTMKLNPHGDATIYETMVRLTRGNNSLLHPFVDSKGNFGKQYSRDMAYAASRYTEVKLDSICSELFKNIDKDSVDFIDNYDGSLKEPILFPVTFPNILVTPNQGIAVSMASNICSFNLKEICALTVNYIKNSKVDVKKYLKAPDFATGGELLYNEAELEKIYNTGRGSFKVRGKYRYDKKNSLIEVYEIPYTTTIEVIIDKIINLIKVNKIREINDIRNETDLSGLKITIDIKRNVDPDKLMRKLFSMTPLCDTFSCNFNILIGETPKTMAIKEIIEEWLKFRIQCVKRQTIFDLRKKNEKFHLLEGLSKILLDIDKAIKIIRDTEEDKEVIPNLMKGFGIDEKQAEYIAEIRLRNLNKEYLLKRINEREELAGEIKKLEEIKDSEILIKQIISDELKEISKKFGKPRNTDIIYQEEEEDFSEDEFIEDYPVKLFLTKHSYLKKITLVSLRSSGNQKLKDDDEIIQSVDATNKMELLLFSDKHNVYKIKLFDIPECKASSLGEYSANILSMEDDENIIHIVPISEYSGYMIFGFENGKVAKTDMKAYMTKMNRKRLINAYSDKAGLVFVKHIYDDCDLIAIRDDDKALLFNTSLVEAKTTKNSTGTQIYKLKKGSKVSGIIDAQQFCTENAEFYRTDIIPSTGHFLKQDDLNANQIKKQQ